MPEVHVINPTSVMTPQKLRVCAYARVSSDSDDQLNSFLAQVKYYTDLIQNNTEWEFVDIYADEGLTGTRVDKRDDFQRLLKDCRKGRIDRILTKSISRFSRNTRDCLETIRELKSLGVEVEFEKERINTGKISSEMIVGVLGSMAQEESISISNNMRLGYQMRMKNGNFITCCPPFGYKLSGRDLIIDNQEAQIVRRIFYSYLSGTGVKNIAEELTECRVQKRDGSFRWSHTSLLYILTNEKYIGNSMLQKYCTTDTLPFRSMRNTGQKDRYYIENSHTAIISKKDFESVQYMLQSKHQIYCPDRADLQYPLSKKIFCGECGHTFKRKVCRGRVYWVCRNHDWNLSLCSVKQIPESEIYSAFIRMYNKLRAHYRIILIPMLEQLNALQSHAIRENTKIGEIDKEIAELNGQNLVLNRLMSKGYMDSSVFMEQTNALNAKINHLRAARRQLVSRDDEDQTLSELQALVSVIESSTNTLTDFDETIFLSIVGHITVPSSDKLVFQLSGGLALTESLKGLILNAEAT